MAEVSGSATGVGALAALSVPKKGEKISVSISGTYSMVIAFEKEVSPGANAWREIKRWSTANATVAYEYTTSEPNERVRLNVLEDTSGTAVYSYSDGDKTVGTIIRDGTLLQTRTEAGVVEEGTFKIKGNLLTEDGIGAAVAGVTAVEHGGGSLHKTVLTLSAFSLGTLGDQAGQGQYGGAKVYDFPEGLICFFGATIDGSITLGAPAIDTWDGDIGLGVEAPTDHQDASNKAGLLLPTVSTTQAVAKVANVDAGSVATALTESGARWQDGTTTAKDLFLNLLVDDNAAHDNTITTAFTGTITFLWANLGDY